MSGGRAWRLVQVLLAVAVLALAARQLAANWAEFRLQRIEWRFSPPWLMLSAVTVFLMYAVLIEAWRRVVQRLDRRLTFIAAARVWMVASLGKYVPGKVWAVAGAALLAQRAGISAQAAVVAAVVLQSLALGSGFALVGLVAPRALAQAGAGVVWGAVLVGAVAAGGLVVLAWPAALRALSRLLPAPLRELTPVPADVLLQAFLANCLAWLGYGAAFLFLYWGLFGERVLSFTQAVAVFTSSYLVGLIALIAPGGLGARESVVFLLLVGSLGAPTAAALTVASRLLLTVTELGGALPFLLASRGHSRR